MHGLFIASGQYNLRSPAHAQGTLVLVQGFRCKFLALFQHELVQVRQHRRIEADGVFHQQDHLYPHLLHIVLQVHLVLNQLDDGHQQVRIPQPAEHVLKDAQVLVLHTRPDTVRERREHHQRYFLILLLDGTRNVEGVAVVRARHHNYQVEGRVPQLLPGLLLGRHLRESGRVSETQVHVLDEDLFIDASVIFQHECIVRIGHQQHVEDSLGHQVHERCILEI